MTPRKLSRQGTPVSGNALAADDSQILTPAEVARVFRVVPKTVTNWANAGKLHSFRTLGGQRRYYASEVRKLLGDGRTGRPETDPEGP